MPRREIEMLILANNKQWNAVKTLIDKNNSNINYQSMGGEFSLLHIAAMQGNMKATACLLNRGVDKGTKTSTGVDAAHIARSFAYFDLEHMLNSFVPEEVKLAGEEKQIHIESDPPSS